MRRALIALTGGLVAALFAAVMVFALYGVSTLLLQHDGRLQCYLQKAK